MNNDPKRKCLTVTVDLSRAVWRKSSHSGANGDCVEVAGNLPSAVAVRDSKDRGGAALAFTPEEWSTFVGGVKDGEFDFR
jgi:hypothetical protein